MSDVFRWLDELAPEPVFEQAARSSSGEFPARYHGTCAEGDHIAPGDLVRYVDDQLTHVDCTVVDEKPFEACPKCSVSPCDCEEG